MPDPAASQVLEIGNGWDLPKLCPAFLHTNSERCSPPVQTSNHDGTRWQRRTALRLEGSLHLLSTQQPSQLHLSTSETTSVLGRSKYWCDTDMGVHPIQGCCRAQATRVDLGRSRVSPLLLQAPSEAAQVIVTPYHHGD